MKHIPRFGLLNRNVSMIIIVVPVKLHDNLDHSKKRSIACAWISKTGILAEYSSLSTPSTKLLVFHLHETNLFRNCFYRLTTGNALNQLHSPTLIRGHPRGDQIIQKYFTFEFHKYNLMDSPIPRKKKKTNQEKHLLNLQMHLISKITNRQRYLPGDWKSMYKVNFDVSRQYYNEKTTMLHHTASCTIIACKVSTKAIHFYKFYWNNGYIL